MVIIPIHNANSNIQQSSIFLAFEKDNIITLLSLGITFFTIGMVENQNLAANVVFLIGIIVANVPEGLLATVTVSVTLTARRMFDKNVRVKNLESIDTLGLTSVIRSDKTSTLTTNVMTCQHIFYDLKECECDTDNPLAAVSIYDLHLALKLCNKLIIEIKKIDAVLHVDNEYNNINYIVVEILTLSIYASIIWT